jgi:hypothetical protein
MLGLALTISNESLALMFTNIIVVIEALASPSTEVLLQWEKEVLHDWNSICCKLLIHSSLFVIMFE